MATRQSTAPTKQGTSTCPRSAHTDLRYGWHQERFELTDVRINSSVELLHRDGDGDWLPRDPTFELLSSGDTEAEQREAANAFESVAAVRFAGRRFLSAKARPASYDDRIYHGVPEDRKSLAPLTSTRLNEVEFSIHAIEAEDWTPQLTAGTVAHMEAGEVYGESTYIQLRVSSNVFDDIERIASQPNVSLEAFVNVRGWHWLGPISDSETYIDPKKREHAELAGFSAARTISDPPQPTSMTISRPRLLTLWKISVDE